MWMEHDLSGSSIVAADDDPANLLVLESMLGELGCEARLVRDGGMLLQSVAMKVPDLVLLDVHMPGVDGYQTCARLKEDERFKDIPVIFISAANEEFSKVKGFELGAVDYITKPFQLEELKARIGVHLKLARQARELRNLQAAVEQSRTSIIITDLNGTIEYANHSASEVTGYELSEIIGSNPRIFKSGVHSDEMYQELWETISRGNVWSGELCNRKKDGSFYWELVVISPVRGVDGSFTRYVAVKEDITEQRELREQLISAKEQAEAANQAKSSFLAMMSHEIRTPMNGVIGMIDLLNQTPLDDEQQRLARIAKVSSMSLLNIINDILDFSKIEAGKMKLESIPVTWRGLIDSVAEMVSGSLLDKHLNLFCLVDPAVPNRVRGDHARLRQLLLNLLSNAIKFTSTTGNVQGDILVRLFLHPEHQDTLVLEVEDNGVGISPEQLENLFHPFVQADTSTHRRYGGSGLGLSICSRLVSLMQGEIHCVSQEGEGSKFVVTLPCVPVNHDKPELSLDDYNILLLSNDIRISEYLERDLTARGANVLSAEDVRKKGVGVLLFAGTWKTAEKERLVHAYQHRYPQTPSVVLISESEREEKRAFKEGVLAEINPFRPEAIHKALKRAMGCGEHQEEALPEKLVGNTHPLPSLAQAEAEGRLILVAEDNVVNQEVIKRQLNLLGYVAEIAENGEVALNKMQQRSYGLLLTDCHMPRMDGFELTSRIRDQELHEETHLPVIAITANAMQGESQRCMLAGMDGYLAKPVELTKLKETLARWLPLMDEPVKGERSELPSDSETLNISEQSSSVIDHQLMSRYLGDDKKIQHYFLHKFTEDNQQVMASVAAHIEQKNWRQVAEMMHKLKSSSKAIGAMALSELCIQLEQAAKNQDAAQAGKLCTGVANEFERVSEYVEQMPE
ncbi:hypothetical protein DI392_11805 [Vibrio albus]|uniref:Sensory/regulatory protein RpfC n=1 Tax=Vibrio albus TaxID=2200953 RepID=A0A2U3B874_9VIBR|nr:response regulator [Vibrio albus]PWI32993.1 hypothetical protein DI392_11805 [Vibrio albus]